MFHAASFKLWLLWNLQWQNILGFRIQNIFVNKISCAFYAFLFFISVYLLYILCMFKIKMIISKVGYRVLKLLSLAEQKDGIMWREGKMHTGKDRWATKDRLFSIVQKYQERTFSFKHSFTESDVIFDEDRGLFWDERSINNGYLLPSKCQVLSGAMTLIDDVTKPTN